MKTQLQLTLLLAAALFLAWGLALMLAPQVTHNLISSGSFDKVTSAMLGATFLGLMVTLLIAARDPAKEVVRASAATMTLIGFTAAYFMFLDNAMPLSVLTAASLFVDLACAVVMFLIEGKLDIQKHASKPTKTVKLATARRRARA